MATQGTSGLILGFLIQPILSATRTASYFSVQILLHPSRAQLPFSAPRTRKSAKIT
jgi:hypothetical protein